LSDCRRGRHKGNTFIGISEGKSSCGVAFCIGFLQWTFGPRAAMLVAFDQESLPIFRVGKTTLVSEPARTVLREESANSSMPVLALVAVFALAFGKEDTWDVLVFSDPFVGRVGSIP
jgi:hypothetical protein